MLRSFKMSRGTSAGCRESTAAAANCQAWHIGQSVLYADDQLILRDGTEDHQHIELGTADRTIGNEHGEREKVTQVTFPRNANTRSAKPRDIV
jgi:hypothetical protein